MFIHFYSILLYFRLTLLHFPQSLLKSLFLPFQIATQRASDANGPAAALPSVLLALNGALLGLALSSKFAMALPTIAWLGLYNLAALRGHAHAAAVAAAPGKGGGASNTDLNSAAAALGWLAADAAIRGLFLLGGAALTYVGVLWLHFSLVPMVQWKSDHYTMAAPPYDDLVPCSHCVPPLSGAAEHASFSQRLDDYTRNQWSYNSRMDEHFPPGTHPFGSRWWSWPLNFRGIHFDLSAAAGVQGTAVYLIGSPVVQLASTVGVLLGLAYIVFAWSGHIKDEERDALGPLYLAVGGWALHYLPFAFVARDCFLTYYILAAYFALLTLTIVMDLLCGGGAGGVTVAGGAVMGMLGVCAVAMFVYLTPLSYADDAAPEQYWARARVASVECWFVEDCWASQAMAAVPQSTARRKSAGGGGGGGAAKPKRGSSKGSSGSRGSRESGRSGTTTGNDQVEAAVACVDDDRILSTAVGKPMSCFVVAEADMCDVLLGTPAEGACGCSC